MANLDFPGVCLSCSDEQCNITAPDVSAAAERVKAIPSGYTRTIINNLKQVFPDKFSSDEEAYMAFDVMKAIIAMGLKNADTVDLEGLGKLSTDSSSGRKKVVFEPARVLEDAVNE